MKSLIIGAIAVIVIIVGYGLCIHVVLDGASIAVPVTTVSMQHIGGLIRLLLSVIGLMVCFGLLMLFVFCCE